MPRQRPIRRSTPRYSVQTGNCFSMTAAADRTHGLPACHADSPRSGLSCLSTSRCTANQRGYRTNAAFCSSRCLSWGSQHKQHLCLRAALIGCSAAATPPQQPLCMSSFLQQREPWSPPDTGSPGPLLILSALTRGARRYHGQPSAYDAIFLRFPAKQLQR